MNLNDSWKIDFFNQYFDESLSEKQAINLVKNKNRYLQEPLYQYTKIKHSEDMINDNLMFLSTLEGFNDPLEGDLKCNFDKMINIVLDEELYKNFSDEQKEQIKSDYKNAEIKNYKNGWERVKEQVSVACFCEKYDINPMWAHYADNHQGICVEYDFTNCKPIMDLCFPVYYIDEANNTEICLKILKDFKAKNRLISQLFLKKGRDWSYEKEWRIVIPNTMHIKGVNFQWKNRKRYLKFLKPEAVYLGYKVNDDDKKYLKAMCRDYDIKIYKMIKDDTGYNLKAKQL